MSATDAELIVRYKHVEAERDKAVTAYQRMKAGIIARTRKVQWAGCLNFTILQIESEMRERGLLA
jgi:hypothetical protein